MCSIFAWTDAKFNADTMQKGGIVMNIHRVFPLNMFEGK